MAPCSGDMLNFGRERQILLFCTKSSYLLSCFKPGARDFVTLLRALTSLYICLAYSLHSPITFLDGTDSGNATFARLPQIAVFERRQREAGAQKQPPLTYVPMEHLEIFDDKQLIFACIRLARLEKVPPSKEQRARSECLIEFWEPVVVLWCLPRCS